MILDDLLLYIEEQVESERENLKEAIRLAGNNCPGAAMCMGALDAYEGIIDFLKEPSPNE